MTLGLWWVIWFSIVINISFKTWNWGAYVSFINIGRKQSLISAFTDSLWFHMAENVLKVSIVSFLCILYCYTFHLSFNTHVHEILEKTLNNLQAYGVYLKIFQLYLETIKKCLWPRELLENVPTQAMRHDQWYTYWALGMLENKLDFCLLLWVHSPYPRARL